MSPRNSKDPLSRKATTSLYFLRCSYPPPPPLSPVFEKVSCCSCWPPNRVHQSLTVTHHWLVCGKTNNIYFIIEYNYLSKTGENSALSLPTNRRRLPTDDWKMTSQGVCLWKLMVLVASRAPWRPFSFDFLAEEDRGNSSTSFHAWSQSAGIASMLRDSFTSAYVGSIRFLYVQQNEI